MKFCARTSLIALACLVTACGGGGDTATPSASGAGGIAAGPAPIATPVPTEAAVSSAGARIAIAPVATFEKPWAFNFLPDGRIVTTEAFVGLRLVTQLGVMSAPIGGLPAALNVPFDIVASPNFAIDRTIYLSYSELGAGATKITPTQSTIGDAGLAVLTARLDEPASGPVLSNVKVIWRQAPKNSNAGEYGGKLAFSPDGRYLFITSGDRSTFGTSQQLNNTLGKTIRLFADGSVPPDNPGAGKPDVAPELWSLGHRNAYGIAFDRDGQLWQSEHGPKGGDEFNPIDFGANYGWPVVSWGDNYDGGLIRKPAASDPFLMPSLYWTPAIAPAGMFFYNGPVFTEWQGVAILGGLQSQGLVMVRTSGRTAAEIDRLPLKARIRDVRQAADGSIWVLEDAPTGRLLRLTRGS